MFYISQEPQHIENRCNQTGHLNNKHTNIWASRLYFV